MAALTVNTFRDITEGYLKRLDVKAAAAPFQGSLLGRDANGFARPLVAGDPFCGVAFEQLENAIAGNVPTVDGGNTVQARVGRFKMVVTLAGITLADVFARKQVYATTDNDFTVNPSAGTATLIGTVDGIMASGVSQVVVECTTQERCQAAIGSLGLVALGDVPLTLTPFHLDKILTCANSVARTITLPPAANCAGRFLSFIKTTAAAAAVTLQGNAAENINGSNTNATLLATQFLKGTLYSDGTQWLIVA